MPSSPRHLGLILLATSLAFALIQLDVTIVNVALPRIASQLHASLTSLQWVVDAYAVVFSVLLLSAGVMGDRFGAKRVFLIGLAVFAAASLACGLAPTAEILIAARTIQGVGAALMLPSSLTLLNHACEGDAALRSRSIGKWTAAGGVAIAAGPIVGGLLLHSTSWRSIFLVNIPICIFGGWLSAAKLEEVARRGEREPLDLVGQFFAIAALAGLSAAVIESRPLGTAHPVVMICAGVAVVAGVAFFLRESRVPHPMLPLPFFRRPNFSPALAVGIALNLTYYGIVFVLSLYLQRELRFSALTTGLAYLPLTATFIGANIASGAITARFGGRVPIVLGTFIAAIGFALLLVAGSHTPYWYFLPAFLLIPTGMGLAIPAVTTAILGATEKTFSGVATGVLNAGRQAGGAMGVAIFGALCGRSETNIVHGLRSSAIVATVLLAIVGAIAFRFISNVAVNKA